MMKTLSPILIRMLHAWVILLLATLLFGTHAGAYFVPAGLGVRPAGLGGAYVAVADDANSVLFNPAGYAGMEYIEVVSMYSELFSGFNARLFTGELDRTGYNFLSAAIPFGSEIGTFGLAWIQLDSLIYSENTYVLSYGRTLDIVPLDVGVNFKVLHWQVAKNQFTTQNSYYPYLQFGRTGYTADIGFKSTPVENLTVAASVENVVPVDMGLTRIEMVPMVVRAGAAYRLALNQSYIDHLLISGELDLREDGTDNILNPRLGLESRHAGLLALRAGISRYDFAAGLSAFFFQVQQTPLGLQLDYAYCYPFQITGTGGSHRIGLKVQWNHQKAIKESKASDSAPTSEPTPLPDESTTSSELELPETLVISKPIVTSAQPTVRPTITKLGIPDKNPHKIVIGIDQTFSNQKKPKTKTDLQKIFYYLREKINIKIESRTLPLEELKKQFVLGEIDVIVSYSEYFYEYYKDGLIRPAVMIQSQGKPTYQYYLYVSQDSSISNKEQLKGRRLGCLGSEKMKYLRTIMYQDLPNFNETKYFSAIMTYQAPMEAVLALQMGTVDALLGKKGEYQLDARDSGENGVKIHGELKSIAESEPLPNIPVLIKKVENKKKKANLEKIVDLMLQAHQIQQMQDVLNHMEIDRLVPFEEKKYRNYLGGR